MLDIGIEREELQDGIKDLRNAVSVHAYAALGTAELWIIAVTDQQFIPVAHFHHDFQQFGRQDYRNAFQHSSCLIS